MNLDFSKVNFEGRWFDFRDGARLKIRPYPRSKVRFTLKDGSIILRGGESLEIFRFCLLEWEGIVGPAGQALTLTDAVKGQLFDSGLAGISEFVLLKNGEMLDEMRDEEKNS